MFVLYFFIHNPLFDSYHDNSILKNIDYYFNNSISRVCVPFFFICTGYLLYKENDTNNEIRQRIEKQIIRLLVLFGIWNFLSYNNQGPQFWYITATIFSLIVLLISIKTKKENDLLIVTSILFIVGTIYMNFHDYFITSSSSLASIINMYDESFGTTRNGLFFGIFFVLFGRYLHKKEKKLSIPLSILGFALSLLFLLFETIFIDYCGYRNGYDMYVFQIPASYFLFCLAKNITIAKDTTNIRNMSTLIYCSHIFIKKVINKVLLVLNLQLNSIALSISTLTICVIFSLEIIYLSKNKKFSFLHYLY